MDRAGWQSMERGKRVAKIRTGGGGKGGRLGRKKRGANRQMEDEKGMAVEGGTAERTN